MAPSRLQLQCAARTLAAGGIVAYPTEGVWGLGCEPLNGHAVMRLLQVKRRNLDKGVILIAAAFSQLQPFVAPLPQARMQPALHSWPGPNTWVLPAAQGLPAWLTGGRPTLAVRVSAHPVAAALCSAYGGAIVSTSANISTRPPAQNALQVRRIFGHRVDFVLPGATGGLAGPTAIRELSTGTVLRP